MENSVAVVILAKKDLQFVKERDSELFKGYIDFCGQYLKKVYNNHEWVLIVSWGLIAKALKNEAFKKKIRRSIEDEPQIIAIFTGHEHVFDTIEELLALFIDAVRNGRIRYVGPSKLWVEYIQYILTNR